MRILVTGAAGMLGSAMVPQLVESGHAVVATDIRVDVARPWGADGPAMGFLDVRRSDDVVEAALEIRPDLIVHLAAETDLEVCELEPEYAAATNVLGTKHATLAARLVGAPVAYISTAGVFDGEKEGAYVEFDEPNPVNVYGQTKLAGERVVETLHPEHYIVRAGWMVGGGPGKDHKFVSRIVDQIRDGASVVYAVNDRFGAPTYVADFSRCFEALVRSRSFGLYHMCGTGSGSRYDVARAILDILGADGVELVEVSSTFFAAEFFVARPPSERMENLMLRLQGMDTMRHWREALEDYLERFYSSERYYASHHYFAAQPELPLAGR